MQLNEEQLQQVELFASRGFTFKQITIILDLSEEECEFALSNRSSTFYKAYMRGFLKAEMDLRNAIYNSALSGSSPAQAEMIKFFKDAVSELKITIGHA